MTIARATLDSRRLAEISLGVEKVYPDDADGVLLASNTTDWGVGGTVEVVPASTITKPFVITGITISEGPGAEDGEHQVEVYYGAGDSVVAKVRYSLSTVRFDHVLRVNGGIGGAPIPANSRIRAALAYSLGSSVGASSAVVSVSYVELTE